MIISRRQNSPQAREIRTHCTAPDGSKIWGHQVVLYAEHAYTRQCLQGGVTAFTEQVIAYFEFKLALPSEPVTQQFEFECAQCHSKVTRYSFHASMLK